jgi:hypothetical protein
MATSTGTYTWTFNTPSAVLPTSIEISHNGSIASVTLGSSITIENGLKAAIDGSHLCDTAISPHLVWA